MRDIFDQVINEFQFTFSRVLPIAKIICNKDFENVLIKIQDGKASILNDTEVSALRGLEIKKTEIQCNLKTTIQLCLDHAKGTKN